MITIRRITTADLALMLELRAQAGWNQTEVDLRRFLDLSPAGSFVADWDDVLAGTVCTFVFGSTAWIAMVLVAESLRGNGIGTALMRHALTYLDGLGIERVRLDATPLGRPVYEKLDFVAEYDVVRYEGVVSGCLHDRADFAPLADISAFDRLVAFDAAVIGADRSAMLRHLFSQSALFRIIERAGCVEGYITSRMGECAFQIGPCLAATEEAGGKLFEGAFWDMRSKRVYVDIPAANSRARAAAAAVGLSVQRTLTRMCRGPRPAERTEMIWASSGPEKG